MLIPLASQISAGSLSVLKDQYGALGASAHDPNGLATHLSWVELGGAVFPPEAPSAPHVSAMMVTQGTKNDSFCISIY